MIVAAWAEEFADRTPLPAAARQQIALHLTDTAVAFFAGCGAADARALARFHDADEAGTTRLDGMAAAVAAITRRTECDDIHMASCVTPGAVVMPVALAAAAIDETAAGRFDRAVAAGYAVGLRLGTAIGGPQALTRGVWPTYFAAPMMAAAAAAVCLDLDAGGIAAAIALAAAGAGGRAGRAAVQGSGRWLVLGEAVAKGCRAALAAAQGFQGDVALVSPDWLRAVAGVASMGPQTLSTPAIAEAAGTVGLKPFVAARQTTNAVMAFQRILRRGVELESIARIEIGVPPVNLAMVDGPASGGDRLSTIANMQFQIAATALRPALLYDIERDGQPAPELQAFASRIMVVADPALESGFPGNWAGRALVVAGDRRLEETCRTIPGDPGEDQAAVIREKLRHMVPAEHRRICETLLSVATEDDAATARKALWQAIRAALWSGER